MKRNILCFILGLIVMSGIAYAADVLIPASSISFESEYTEKTNVADALTELLEGGTGCPNGFSCDGVSLTITYNVNGGTLQYTNDNFLYNEKYNKLPRPKKEGYAFGGWYLDNGLTKYVGNETKVKIAENHTLYAMWGSPVEVTFEANGGKLTTSTKEVTQNGRYGTLPRGYKEGYVLEGWYSDSELTNKVTESTKVTNGENHTLYAKWVENTKPALYDVVLNQLNTTKKSEGMVYSSMQSDLGVYEYDGPTSSDGGELPIYFYRGAVTNNNVLFAGYCWKIIRTTSTGGTKLIYAGLPTGTAPNYVCNNTGTKVQVESTVFSYDMQHYYDIYYVYDKEILHGVKMSSTIKSYIENTWFPISNFVDNNGNENLTYKNLLEDTPFCIDRRYGANGSSTIKENTNIDDWMMYGGYIRANYLKPSLDCYHNNNYDTDKLTVSGKHLSKKIGLITYDEIMLAGGGTSFNNSSYYLYTGEAQWSISPGYQREKTSYGYSTFIAKNGSIANQYSSYSGSVRPVVSLSIGAKVDSGDGSSSSPYKIN